MKRLLLSLAVVAAVSSLAVGSTFAVFSDQEVVAGNTVSMGTLDLTVNTPLPFNITNAYPGWVSDVQKVDLYNTGTLPLEAMLDFNKTAGSGALYNKLRLNLWGAGLDDTCGGGDDVVVYSGMLKDYPAARVVSSQNYWHNAGDDDGTNDAFWGNDNIRAGWTERMCISIEVDPSAGNGLMGASTTFNLVANAAQDND